MKRGAGPHALTVADSCAGCPWCAASSPAAAPSARISTTPVSLPITVGLRSLALGTTALRPPSLCMMSSKRHLLPWGAALGALGLVSACGPTPHQSATNAPVAQSNAAINSAALAPVVSPAPAITPTQPGNVAIDSNAAASFAAGAAEASLPAAGKAIDAASFQPAPAKASHRLAYDPVLLKAEVLLDRAGFSPGVIDGKGGTNLQHALEAFAVAHGLASSGSLDAGTWNALTGADAAPAMQSYVITADDEAGPFIGAPPKDYKALSKLPALGYSSPLQELAERFHMDPALLQSLNPGADFSKVGQTLLVAAPRAGPRDLQVTRIEVDKSDDEVRAFGSDGKLLAFYPATV